MYCTTCAVLRKMLVEEIASSCDGCDYHEYSTKACSDYCENPKSPKSEGWMTGAYGCKFHSRIAALDIEVSAALVK